MLNRTVWLALCLSVIAGAAFAQTSNQGTGYVFEFATGSSGSAVQFQGFLASLGTPVFPSTPGATGPAGNNPQVVAKPDGSKFYLVNAGGVDDFDPNFTTAKSLNGISGTISQAIITPDGRYLLLADTSSSGANTLYVVDTSSDNVVLNPTANGPIVGIAASHDSTTAWILAKSPSFTYITPITLSSPQKIGQSVALFNATTGEPLIEDPTALTLSPLGLLYASGGNNILEIDPSTLNAAAPTFVSIGVNATAGPLQFSPDGTLAYLINETPTLGQPSLLSVSFPAHGVTSWPPYIPGETVLTFDSILVAAAAASGSSTPGPTRVLAHSPSGSIWDVAPDLTTAFAACGEPVCVSTLTSLLPDTNVLSIVLSNEVPSARFLYALAGSSSGASLYGVDLNANTVFGQASAALGPGTLQFSIVPPQANPAGFFQLNASQTLTANATAAPLIAQVLDSTGRPMFAVPVTFTDPSGTLTFKGGSAIANGVSLTSNENGYVQTTVTLGATPGSYPVTLTAGSGATAVTTTFALIIPGSTTGPTGTNQVTIVIGNGQLLAPDSDSVIPMTVQVNDTNGNPLPNVAVTFTVTGPIIGYLATPNATTDVNGMASTTIFTQFPPENTPFQMTTVTAVAVNASGVTLGSATFDVTVFQDNSDTTGSPEATMNPSPGTTITAGEGDVGTNQLVAQIFSGSFGGGQPIPNIGIRIIPSIGNPLGAAPGYCQGNPLSDSTGTVTCNFVGSCSAGLGIQSFYVSVGELLYEGNYSVNIVPGATHALTSKSGNNQSGRPGAALSLPLTVNVSDLCGAPAPNTIVSWKVASGSATLSAASTATNGAGNAGVVVTLGQTPGPVQIVASINASTAVTFTETIQAVVGSLTLISGGGQSAVIAQPFKAPLVFQLADTKNNPISGLIVNFALAGGSASINPTSATTNAQGQVSVAVTAGNTPGTVTITATYSTFTTPATLTVNGIGPSVTVSSFVNAGSGQAGLTPCGLALVTGAGLAPGVPGVILGGNALGIGPLPYTLVGVSISVNGTPAPIQAVSNQGGVQQVNFQTPCETVPGSPATVVVTVDTVSTSVPGVTVFPAQPGIFTYPGPSGINYGYIIDSSGNALTPSNLAQAGQTYYMFATGLGQTTPPATTNSKGLGQTIPVSSITLAINNVGVPVSSVQYLEGALGEYLVTFSISVGVFPTGANEAISLGVTINGQTFNDNSPVALPGIH